MAVALEIITDDAESMCSLDVSIHQDGVVGEQLCVRWKIQGDDEIFQFLGAGDVGVLEFSYILQLPMNPDTECVEQTTATGDDWLGLPRFFVDFYRKIKCGE